MRMRISKFMRISADADPDAELRYTSNIYDYLCVQTENCGFIINGVIVKDEENANY